VGGVGWVGLAELARSAPPPQAGVSVGGVAGSPGGLVHGAAGFPDGAPARVTGGFGEDSCLSCHWEFEGQVDTRGSLLLSGVPDRWETGASYELVVEVSRPGMAVGGFQLAARFVADTTQAGTFQVPESESHRVMILEEGGLEFAQHREDGIPVIEGEDGLRWRVTWVAPDAPRAAGASTPPGGEVALHLAGVAGDGDRSQMGDRVYTREALVAGPAR
jgi:hypothetical protein